MNRTAAILAAVWLMPAVALAQDWKVYSYPDPGFAVQFPEPPTVEKTTFKTASGAPLPMTRYAAREDGIVFTLEVVDYSSTGADGPGMITAAEKAFGVSGKVTVAIDARINRSFGRELSVEDADGGRSVVALFFVDKHLYRLVGEALPPNAKAKSGDASRFQQSLQFIGENGGFGGGLGGGFGGGGPGGGRFAGQGGGRFRGGGFNPDALTACTGKSAGDAVQLTTPGGTVQATCTLVARPNRPRPAAPDAQHPGA